MENKLKVLDLFSGIGGFSLGLELTGGFETVAFCEIEKFPQKVLKKHWPDVPIYKDVRLLNGKELGTIDVICGGFPCQDISKGNTTGEGIDGSRSGLWWEFYRLIDEVGPKWAIIENSPVLRSRGLSTVLQNLSEIGYDAEWHCIPASFVGADHGRDRIWIIANPNSGRRKEAGVNKSMEQVVTEKAYEQLQVAKSSGLSRQQERIHKPGMARIVDDVLDRVDRDRALGNSVVPWIPEMIGYAILNATPL